MPEIASISATTPTALYTASAGVKAVIVDAQDASGDIRCRFTADVSSGTAATKGFKIPAGQLVTFTADMHGWLARGMWAVGDAGAVTGVVVEVVNS